MPLTCYAYADDVDAPAAAARVDAAPDAAPYDDAAAVYYAPPSSLQIRCY